MRTCPLLLPIVLLAACGGGASNLANEPPKYAAQPGKLTVNARPAGDGYEFTLNDSGTAISEHALRQELNTYAARVDVAANLRGLGKDGISANPVVFTAPPGVPSEAFFMLLELAATERLFNIEAQLELPAGKPKQFHVPLPIDEGFRDYDPSERLPESLVLTVEAEAPSTVQYSVSIDGRARKPVPDGRTDGNALLEDDWNQDEYDRLRTAVARDLTDYETKSGANSEKVEIGVGNAMQGSGPYPVWAAVIVGIEAVSDMNKNRGDRKRLKTTFKLADVRGKYRDD